MKIKSHKTINNTTVSVYCLVNLHTYYTTLTACTEEWYE